MILRQSKRAPNCIDKATASKNRGSKMQGRQKDWRHNVCCLNDLTLKSSCAKKAGSNLLATKQQRQKNASCNRDSVSWKLI